MRVLVVEDDKKLARVIVRALDEEGFQVDHCSRGSEAISMAKDVAYDSILLDRMLPDGEGLDVCQSLRSSGISAPVLMVTARTDVQDVVEALDKGADDYIGKPFHLDELVARLRAVVRRCAPAAPEVIQAGPVTIELAARAAVVGGARMELTGREFDLLVLLARNKGRVVTRAEMLSTVWHTHRDPGSNVIEVNISNLRDKLGEAADMLETVRGLGYKFVEPNPTTTLEG